MQPGPHGEVAIPTTIQHPDVMPMADPFDMQGEIPMGEWVDPGTRQAADQSHPHKHDYQQGQKPWWSKTPAFKEGAAMYDPHATYTGMQHGVTFDMARGLDPGKKVGDLAGKMDAIKVGPGQDRDGWQRRVVVGLHQAWAPISLVVVVL